MNHGHGKSVSPDVIKNNLSISPTPKIGITLIPLNDTPSKDKIRHVSKSAMRRKSKTIQLSDDKLSLTPIHDGEIKKEQLRIEKIKNEASIITRKKASTINDKHPKTKLNVMNLVILPPISAGNADSGSGGRLEIPQVGHSFSTPQASHNKAINLGDSPDSKGPGASNFLKPQFIKKRTISLNDIDDANEQSPLKEPQAIKKRSIIIIKNQTGRPSITQGINKAPRMSITEALSFAVKKNIDRFEEKCALIEANKSFNFDEEGFVDALKLVHKYQTEKKNDVSQSLMTENTRYDKLKIATKYLYDFKDVGAIHYIAAALPIMQILDEEFKNDLRYKPWVRFIEVLNLKAATCDFKDLYVFLSGATEILQLILGGCQEVDWRISRQLLGSKYLKSNAPPLNFEGAKTGLIYKMNQALDYIVFNKQSFLTRIIKDTIHVLQSTISRKEVQKTIENAIISGRFDKHLFNLKHTVILGEDGNMWLLLNSFKKEKELQDDQDYHDIIIKYGLKDSPRNKHKLMIRKTPHDTFRLGVSLFTVDNITPGQIICIKKVINNDKKATSALDDLLSNEEASAFIYIPKILDMGSVTIEKEPNNHHCKEYLMMEMSTNQTAEDVFKEPKFQRWNYQKPYLLDVFSKYHKLSLLSKKIMIEQVSIANTLFNTDNLKSTLINIHYDPNPPTTEEYNILLSKSCGEIMRQATLKTEHESFNPREHIDIIVKQLALGNMSLIEAISEIKMLGDDNYNDQIIFSHYIAKVKERLSEGGNKTSISINQDINETKKILIDTYTTLFDPQKYKGLHTIELTKEMDEFYNSDEVQILVLLGMAGSGKSVAVQLRFLEEVKAWKPGKPVPIYFNLANGVELETVIGSLNAELGTNLTLASIRKQHFYIDSFDEDIGIEEKRDTLIKDYAKILGNPKMVIACRSDYVSSVNDYGWFQASEKAISRILYIAPINYTNFIDLEKYVDKYLKTKDSKKDVKQIMEKINKYNLKRMMNTGFMFHLIMETIDELTENNQKDDQVTKYRIYQDYISKYVLKKPLDPDQKRVLLKGLATISNLASANIQFKMFDICMFIACQLHLTGTFRINQSSKLFELYKLDPEVSFKSQTIFHILKRLPLKIETKSSDNVTQQRISIGFIHDTVKNYYLVEAIIAEITSTSYSTILASKSIVSDYELIRFIVDAMDSHPHLRHAFRRGIIRTKKDKSQSAVIYSANCITLLVAHRFSFANQDLSNVSIQGANLKNGIFQNVNFSNANLMNVNLSHADLSGAMFVMTNLNGAQFGIRPDLKGHTGEIDCVCFSPLGKFTATGSRDKTVRIWDQTGECLQIFRGHTDTVTCIKYSPDGKFIATSSLDKTVKIWDGEGVEITHKLELLGHSDAILSLSFAPRENFIATASKDKTVKVWDYLSGTCLRTLEGHEFQVNCVSYSPYGDFIASGSNDETLKIWNAYTFICLKTFEGHDDAITSINYSPDGKSIAVGLNKKLKMLESSTGHTLHDFEAHNETLTSLSYSPDGKSIATSSWDKSVKVWDTNTGRCLRELKGHTHAVASLCYSSSGEFIATGSWDKTVKIWNTNTGQSLQKLKGHTNRVSCAGYFSDGKFIATGSRDETVKIWDTETGKLMQEIDIHTGHINSLSISPDGKFLATCDDASVVKIWNCNTGKCIRQLVGHEDRVTCVGYLPSGRFIATGCKDGTAKIWDPVTFECIRDIQAHKKPITCISYSPSGGFLITGSKDQSAKIWDTGTGELVRELNCNNPLTCVAFSPDGKLIAIGFEDKIARVFNWEINNSSTSTCTLKLVGHKDKISGITFSPDSNVIVTASYDATVKLWHVKTGKQFQDMNAHVGSIEFVTYSPDGKFLVTGSDDKSVKIWMVNKSVNISLKHTFSSAESALNVANLVIKHSSISALNERLLQQRCYDIADNTISDNYEDVKNLYLTVKGAEILLLQVLLGMPADNKKPAFNRLGSKVSAIKPEGLRYLGMALEIMGERGLAINMYGETIKKNPGDYQALLRRGKCLNEIADYKAALEDLNKACAILEKSTATEEIVATIKKLVDMEKAGYETNTKVASNAFWKVAWKQTMMRLSRFVNGIIEDYSKGVGSGISQLQDCEGKRIMEKLNYLQKGFFMYKSSKDNNSIESLKDAKKEINSKMERILKDTDNKSQNARDLSLIVFMVIQNSMMAEDIWKFFSLMSREKHSELKEKEQYSSNLLNEVRDYISDYCKKTDKNGGIKLDIKGLDRLDVDVKYEIKKMDLYNNAKDFDESYDKLNQLYSKCEGKFTHFQNFMDWTKNEMKYTKMHYAANLKSKFRVFQKHRELGYDVENDIFLTNAHSNLWDILRCSFFIDCENIEDDLALIFEIFKEKELRIVRVKNKIKTHLQYVMINFIFEDVVCELQVCFNLNKENKYELHFAYELERCQNGCELFFTLLQTKYFKDNYEGKEKADIKAEGEERGVLELYKEMNNIIETFSR